MKNYQTIKKELEQRLEEVKTELSVLEAVKTKAKKDGKPFSALNSNFENAKIIVDQFGKITLALTSKPFGYIYLGYVRNDKALTFETVKVLIDSNIEKCRKSLALADSRLQKLPEVYNAVLESLKKLSADFEGFLGMLDCNDLMNAKYLDYSDKREEKAKEQNTFGRIKKALQGKTGYREEKVLEDVDSIELLGCNKETGRVYKVVAKDGSFIEVCFPSLFSDRDASIVG